MDAIDSGTTSERRTRWLLAFVACSGLAVWFAYDGWVAWPKANTTKVLENLPGVTEQTLRVDPAITAASLAMLEADMTREAIVKRLGKPLVDTAQELRYAGRAGVLIIPLSADRYAGRAEWAEAKKSSFEVFFQKLIAIALAAVGLLALVGLIRIQRMRVVLDDEGLHLGGGTAIAWDAMTGLDGSEFDRRGWVTLSYRSGTGDAQVRLDSYKLAAFDPIVDTICSRKGFENPLPVDSEPDDDEDAPDGDQPKIEPGPDA